jgi:hypothetical protein
MFRAARIGRVLIALFLITVVTVALVAASAAAQTRRDGDFATLILSKLEQGQKVDFLFAQPITGTVRTVSSQDTRVTMGSDYVCFGTPWNDGTREYCVPFSNIVSVTFLEP